MILRVIRRNTEPLPFPSFLFNSTREFSATGLTQLTPENILNDRVRTKCVERLKHLPISKVSKVKPVATAAVLVPLCLHNGKLGLLYTLRSNKVSMNRGQVSFPGGMKDKSDKTLEDTALRETWEELQIINSRIDIWGCANVVDRKDITVLPVLAYIGEVDPKSLSINTQEVEEAFVHPLEKICDPALCRYTTFRNSYVLPTFLGGNHKIWGLTAVITHVIMKALVPEVYKHKLPPISSILHD